MIAKREVKEPTFKSKATLFVAAAIFSVILAFFFTMVLFPDAPDKNKVFGAVAAIVFLIIGCITGVA